MPKLHVTTTINDEPMEFLCEPDHTMLDVLRNDLGLTGSKEGCATGDCGACPIMSQGGRLNSLQQKFLEQAALQCGICTSGMLIASEALLKKNPNPSEEEVRFGLAGNLCRCTGYDKIVRAVLEAASEMREARP